jgi:tellurite resistance protein
MARRYTHSITTTAELLAGYIQQREVDVIQALVSAGAFVALADGRVKLIERDELVDFVDRHGLVAATSKCDIREAFPSEVGALEVIREILANSADARAAVLNEKLDG